MKENIIKNKTFEFALKTIGFYKYLVEGKKEYVLSKQFLRSGTSIGAMVRESEQAESKPDFIHKLAIALKEANECEYWIELLNKSGYMDNQLFSSFSTDINEILRILTSIIKTSKANK
ncbi:MAG: four helix bundle protein [Saprospiraceae bacterium]